MRLVTLHRHSRDDKNGTENIEINPVHVLYIISYGAHGSIIHMTDGHELRVIETLDRCKQVLAAF